jgi:hypothetical protein
MSFLDNTGDILLDAVLTDLGRMRLAKGDGTFRIAKFYLSDDEINYADYDLTQPSATRDTQILMTPILEAMTNNAVGGQFKLLTITRPDLLYLPVIEINNVVTPYCSSYASAGTYVIAVDGDTFVEFSSTSGGVPVDGVFAGRTGTTGKSIRVDQGLDSNEISPEIPIDGTLLETQYQVQIDSRFGSITSAKSGGGAASPSYVDDDYIANYFFTITDTNYVELNTSIEASADEVIAGPRGTTLQFRIKASLDLATNDYLFTTLGTNDVTNWTGKSTVLSDVYYIDSYVRVIGVTTGYSIDIPVRFVRIK